MIAQVADLCCTLRQIHAKNICRASQNHRYRDFENVSELILTWLCFVSIKMISIHFVQYLFAVYLNSNLKYTNTIITQIVTRLTI